MSMKDSDLEFSMEDSMQNFVDEPRKELPPARKLDERSLDAVVKYMLGGPHRKKIVVLVGKGILAAAGMPAISPGTELYDDLAKLNVPSMEKVFDINYFREDPQPFLCLAKHLYPGKFRPTISHAFIALLHKKGFLHMLFTQNFDCLERRAGVPAEKLVEVLGSFAVNRCVDCRQRYPHISMRDDIEDDEIPYCLDRECEGLVKPDIMFSGEQWPPRFIQYQMVLSEADLIMVIGTSLSTQPFASLPQEANFDAPRVLFNPEQTGDFGEKPDDVMCLGSCDEGIMRLANALGWMEELLALHAEVGSAQNLALDPAGRPFGAPMTSSAMLEAQLQGLAMDVEYTLGITSNDEISVEDEDMGNDAWVEVSLASLIQGSGSCNAVSGSQEIATSIGGDGSRAAGNPTGSKGLLSMFHVGPFAKSEEALPLLASTNEPRTRHFSEPRNVFDGRGGMH